LSGQISSVREPTGCQMKKAAISPPHRAAGRTWVSRFFTVTVFGSTLFLVRYSEMIEIQPVVMVNGPDELENAFATMVRERADAVVVQGSLAIKPVTDMALKYRVPTASTARVFAEIGGLMSFGADGPTSFRHGARFVQRILQGKQPKDIPIEQPTKFDLAINLKTAKAIGLTIPEAFLQRADALIE